MAGSRQLAFCALLCVCCAISPHQKQRIEDQQTGVLTHIRTLNNGLPLSGPEEIFDRDRVKRQAEDCPVFETRGGRGLQRIIDANTETKFSFFIMPQPGFNSLVVRAKVNNKLIPGSWKYSRETLVVSSSQIGIDWIHPTWIPVEIEYFKKEINFGPDRHALRVKMGKDFNEELITSWWRTHSYEGFAVEAEGPLKVLWKCNPSDIDKGEVRRDFLIVCIVGGCFLLVVGAATGYFLIARCSRSRQVSQDDPVLDSKSVLRGRRVKKDDECDNIYESIDEVTLAKLKQNFHVDALPFGQADPMKDHRGGSAGSYKNTRTSVLDLGVHTPCHSSGMSSGGSKDTQAISLLEEKEALRDYLGMDSPVENHYVEMHGIVSRTSSLSK